MSLTKVDRLVYWRSIDDDGLLTRHDPTTITIEVLRWWVSETSHGSCSEDKALQDMVERFPEGFHWVIITQEVFPAIFGAIQGSSTRRVVVVVFLIPDHLQ